MFGMPSPSESGISVSGNSLEVFTSFLQHHPSVSDLFKVIAHSPLKLPLTGKIVVDSEKKVHIILDGYIESIEVPQNVVLDLFCLDLHGFPDAIYFEIREIREKVFSKLDISL